MPDAQAADLVRFVRLKISAGDLATGLAMAEDYKKATGVDEEYLNAIGWIARGAEMLDRPEIAREALAELRREIPSENGGDADALWRGHRSRRTAHRAQRRTRRGHPLFRKPARAGARRLRCGRASARTSNALARRADAPALADRFVGADPSLRRCAASRSLLFFFAEWCGDCKAQAASLARVWEKYKPRGLELIAATRLYSTPTDEKPMTPAEEKAQVEKVWKESYKGLEDVPIVDQHRRDGALRRLGHADVRARRPEGRGAALHADAAVGSGALAEDRRGAGRSAVSLRRVSVYVDRCPRKLKKPSLFARCTIVPGHS